MSKVEPLIFTSIDLELNNPTEHQPIIEIGACIGNIKTGEILETLSAYIKIDEPLTPFINTLTGITDNKLETQGTTLLEAYEKLKIIHNKYHSNIMPIQWGGGDTYKLQKDLLVAGMDPKDWIFGYTSMNVKNICQAYRMSKGMSLKGGLAKSMTKLGMKFEGTEHSGVDDSINTFKVLVDLVRRFK